MPAVSWPLLLDRPMIRLTLPVALGTQPLLRALLADTGAGALRDPFELILDEDDCIQCGGIPIQPATLGGAYVGSFPVYLVDVQIPELGFEDTVPAVGVPNPPVAFDGIACFEFLNRFSYGNFGRDDQFGLDAHPTV